MESKSKNIWHYIQDSALTTVWGWGIVLVVSWLMSGPNSSYLASGGQLMPLSVLATWLGAQRYVSDFQKKLSNGHAMLLIVATYLATTAGWFLLVAASISLKQYFPNATFLPDFENSQMRGPLDPFLAPVVYTVPAVLLSFAAVRATEWMTLNGYFVPWRNK